MQTSKVKVGEVYALKREGIGLLRFKVIEIVTRRGMSELKTEIVGYVVEGDTTSNKFTVNPANLVGSYDEYAELVELKRKEDAEREAQKQADKRQAKLDRLMLYEFVGVEPPPKAEDFKQAFRLSFSDLDISREGQRLIVARVRELTAGNNVTRLKVAQE